MRKVPGGISATFLALLPLAAHQASAGHADWITRIGLGVRLKEVAVTFTSGEVYTYYQVPKPVHAAFKAAFSKGRFFNAHIKDRYDVRRHARSA